MTQAAAPISYANAEAACRSAVLALMTAGPDACKLPPSSYVPLTRQLEQTADLLGLHAARVAARAEQGARG